jgi:hypothetical protein
MCQIEPRKPDWLQLGTLKIKIWQILPIYCINQPIKGIDLAMTKNWLIRAINWFI